MLTRRVIAANITNLTDARYFAARGVDYLMFDLGNIPLDKLLGIKEWVEGPEYILVVDPSSLSLIEEAILKVQPAGVHSKHAEVVGELKHYRSHVEVITQEGEHLQIDGNTFCPVDKAAAIGDLSDDIGIIISGGDEEEVGLKNYDDLDDILDYLEED